MTGRGRHLTPAPLLAKERDAAQRKGEIYPPLEGEGGRKLLNTQYSHLYTNFLLLAP
jgi:hypothetical protein